MKNDLLVHFELENASSNEDIKIAINSLISLISSAISYRYINLTSPRIIVTVPLNAREDLIIKVTELKFSYSEIQIEIVNSESHGYFVSKNSVLKYLKSEKYIVFCDSDCTYENSYLLIMHKEMEERKGTIGYGVTYASKRRSSLFERASSLAWQFPPQEIGYESSNLRSRWANSMAVEVSFFSQFPFPQIRLSRFESYELKQERNLWQVASDNLDVKTIEINAVAFHEQFQNLISWTKREWVHGLGRSAKLRNQKNSFLDTVTSITLRLLYKYNFVKKLYEIRKIKKIEFYYFSYLIICAINIEILATIIVWVIKINFEIKWHGVSQIA